MTNMTREQRYALSDALGQEYNKENLLRFADTLMGFANPDARRWLRRTQAERKHWKRTAKPP